MQESIEARVSAGMSKLDEWYPDHVQRVDLGRLETASACDCPLAQASGKTYFDAKRELDLLRNECATYGFADAGVYDDGNESEWSRLTDEWLRQYAERLAAQGKGE